MKFAHLWGRNSILCKCYQNRFSGSAETDVFTRNSEDPRLGARKIKKKFHNFVLQSKVMYPKTHCCTYLKNRRSQRLPFLHRMSDHVYKVTCTSSIIFRIFHYRRLIVPPISGKKQQFIRPFVISLFRWLEINLILLSATQCCFSRCCRGYIPTVKFSMYGCSISFAYLYRNQIHICIPF